jgi:isocitrate lyase
MRFEDTFAVRLLFDTFKVVVLLGKRTDGLLAKLISDAMKLNGDSAIMKNSRQIERATVLTG